MYRTASTARISDEFSIDLLPVTKISQGLKSMDDEKLELYSSTTSHDTKKEASSHLKSPWENSVHLIPLFVIICFLLLWLCSHPVNLVHKPELTVERVGGLNINGHGNQIGLPSSTKLKDLDQLEHTWDRKPLRTSFDE